MPERTQTTIGNLIRQTTAEKIIRPPGFYTSIVLDVLIVFCALFLGFFYRGFLRNSISPIWPLLIFALFALLSVFGMLLTKSMGRRVGAIVLSVFGIVVFFYDLPLPFLAGSALAASGFLIWGEALSRTEIQNSLSIKFFKVVRPYLNKFITAMALLAVLLYLPQWNAAGDFLSPAAFQSLYRFSSRLAMLFYPELKLDSSAEAFARSLAEFQLKTNLAFLQLLPAARERAVEEGAKQILKGLSERTGTEIRPAAPLSLLLYEVIVKNLRGWQEKFGSQLVFGWGIIVFFILRGIGGLLYFLLAGIGFFVYHFLLAINFIKIVGESRMHETLEYS